MTSITLSPGETYIKDGNILRVIAVRDEYALLEEFSCKGVVQYIISSIFQIHDDELCWLGNGEYFPCLHDPAWQESPLNMLTKALAQLNETGNEESEAGNEDKQISYEIDNGVRIVAELASDEHWKSIDIVAEYPNGKTQILCAVDYETFQGNRPGVNRLRVMTYTSEDEDPCNVVEPLFHRSIWITLDEGTYDVNVWDEDANERDDCLEICRIPTHEKAIASMNQVINSHPEIIWTKRPFQNKGGTFHDR